MANRIISTKMRKQRIRFFGIISCCFICGIIYSHGVYQSEIELGKSITAEEFAKPLHTGTDKEKININRALEEELVWISGIGEKRAADIIHYREENGNFQSIEQIMNVPGIGEKTFEQIEEQITVEE